MHKDQGRYEREAHIHGSTRSCMHTYMYAHIHVCTHSCTHTFMHTFMYAHKLFPLHSRSRNVTSLCFSNSNQFRLQGQDSFMWVRNLILDMLKGYSFTPWFVSDPKGDAMKKSVVKAFSQWPMVTPTGDAHCLNPCGPVDLAPLVASSAYPPCHPPQPLHQVSHGDLHNVCQSHLRVQSSLVPT